MTVGAGVGFAVGTGAGFVTGAGVTTGLTVGVGVGFAAVGGLIGFVDGATTYCPAGAPECGLEWTGWAMRLAVKHSEAATEHVVSNLFVFMFLNSFGGWLGTDGICIGLVTYSNLNP